MTIPLFGKFRSFLFRSFSLNSCFMFTFANVEEVVRVVKICNLFTNRCKHFKRLNTIIFHSDDLLRSGVFFILKVYALVRLACKLNWLLFFAPPLLDFCIKLLSFGFECLAFFFYKKSKFRLFLFNCSL